MPRTASKRRVQLQNRRQRFLPDLKDGVSTLKNLIKRFRVIADGRENTIDYLGGALAANFARMLPMRLSYAMTAAKAKLWNLHALKSMRDLFPACHFELIVFRPTENDPSYSDRQMEELHGAMRSLTAEGDRYELLVHPVCNADEAATRIIQQSAVR